MNSNLKFLALGLLAGPIVASAQEYDYTGSLMTGTESVSIYTTPGNLTTTTTPLSEAFSAQIVLSGASLTYTLDLGGGIARFQWPLPPRGAWSAGSRHPGRRSRIRAATAWRSLFC